MFSGIVGTYPVGREAAIAMLRGSVLSWIAFVSSFFVIGLALNPYGLAASLGLGALAGVGTTILVLWIDRVAATYMSAYLK